MSLGSLAAFCTLSVGMARSAPPAVHRPAAPTGRAGWDGVSRRTHIEYLAVPRADGTVRWIPLYVPGPGYGAGRGDGGEPDDASPFVPPDGSQSDTSTGPS